jgi:hypothetical protein
MRASIVNLAIGARSITAAARRGPILRSATVALDTDAGIPRADMLNAAFAELRARLDNALGTSTQHARAHIALLPPHAEVRLVALPPLRRREAAAVLARDAGRYFVAVPAPRVVNVGGAGHRSTLQRATAGLRAAPAGVPVMAAAANADVVEAVRAAAMSAGWQPVSVTCAHAAWLAVAREQAAARRGNAAARHGNADARHGNAAARHGNAAARRGNAAARRRNAAALRCVIAVDAATVHVMQVSDGGATALRRLPPDALPDIIEAAGAPSGGLVIFGDDAFRERLAALASAAGWAVVAPVLDGLEAAARGARAAALPLVPPSVELERSVRDRRRALALAAATVVLLAGAALLELWGAHRELDAVRARRAAIRAEVGPLLALRDSADRLDDYTAGIEQTAAGAPRWTAVLFDLAMLLPPETHLTRLHTTGDTVTVEAEGTRAGATLQALRAAASLRDARLVGAVDRELADGATAVERFRLSARLARPVRTLAGARR